VRRLARVVIDQVASGAYRCRRAQLAGAVAVCLTLLLAAPRGAEVASRVPHRLSDQEFWRLVADMSEENGHFQSDNLVSNELTFQWVIPELQRLWTEGGAYLGVGPDQNFTYLAALQPSIAFIVDIRRDNLRLQLMYKALIELSPTRGVFLSRLFSRPMPEDIAEDAPAGDWLTAFQNAPASQEAFKSTLTLIRDHLTVQHGFALTADDLAGIEYVLSAFLYAGPMLTYGNTPYGIAGRVGGRGGRYPTYQDLMEATDAAGVARSYLANETLYGRLRSLQMRNLVVPVVGDFAGPKALRRVGEYLKAHGAVIGTIYTSNVEQYLFQYGTWPAYYASVGTLPIDDRSVFVRSCFNACMTVPGSRSAQLLDPVAALLRDMTAGRIVSYYDLLAHSR
jgi:hypothetical protein